MSLDSPTMTVSHWRGSEPGGHLICEAECLHRPSLVLRVWRSSAQSMLEAQSWVLISVKNVAAIATGWMNCWQEWRQAEETTSLMLSALRIHLSTSNNFK